MKWKQLLLTLFFSAGLINWVGIELERFEKFSLSDYEEILSKFSYSTEEISFLQGVAVLNSFDQIDPKFDIELSIVSDSITFVGVFRDDKIYFFNSQHNEYRPDFGGTMSLKYNYYKKLTLLDYKLFESKKLVESINYNMDQFLHNTYRGDTIEFQKLVHESGVQVEGAYVVSDSTFQIDTISSFNPFALEEYIELERTSSKQKIGVWKWYDDQGNLIQLEEY